MNEFNNWWNKQYPDNKQTSNLQFTELTEDDKATHEDLYIHELLVSNFTLPSGCSSYLYYDYAIIELQKANTSWLKTFG